jgi:RNA polymerase sigma-70 factor (sigma-E family)
MVLVDPAGDAMAATPGALDDRRGAVEPGETFEELYRREFAGLLRVARLLGLNQPSAEDVVQEAFMRIHARAQPLDDASRVGAYLRVSVVNAARSHHRRRAVRLRHRRVADVRPDVPADEAFLLGEQYASVAAAVRALPARQQRVVVLRYWSGMSEAEIADALGVSAGTVKSTASRALAKLTRRLGEDRRDD